MITNTEQTLVLTRGKPCNVSEKCVCKKETTNVNLLSLQGNT